MATRLPMVGWFDPGQLLKTGIEVLVSTTFGRHADHRLIEAIANPNNAVHDYTAHDDGTQRTSLWLDYVGDVGDGWNPTYAVAYALAQPTLALPADGGKLETHRGAVLVFGGDQVYPTASAVEYRQRFVEPYRTALPRSEEPVPDAFAIPGNHDWYDSLVSYSRLFCQQRWIGGWRTKQACSYFALKLPHGWWVLGTDVQLGSDVDTAQRNFFHRVAGLMGPHDAVILCHAEPHWIAAAAYERWDPEASERNIVYLEDKILGGRVRVFVAGDLHHYRRHEAPDGTQKITCGGGGAFLHPTHGHKVGAIDERGLDGRVRRTFTLAASYPPEATSRSLTWRNLRFMTLNPKLAVFTAALYAVLGWAVLGPVGGIDEATLGGAFRAVLGSLGDRAGMSLLLVGVLLAVILFTDTHSRFQRIVGGGFHGLAHLGAMLTCSWVGASSLDAWMPDKLGAVLGALGGGFIIAPLILGVYLLMSLNVFGRHSNEAFSSLRIEDWKSFLRFRIAEDGTLTIYPIGIQRVPRRWKPAADPGGLDTSEMLPDDADGTQPALIEQPIVVPRTPKTKGG